MAATINMFPLATLNLMPLQTENTMGTTLLPATMATAGTTCILLQQAGQTPPPTPSSCKTVRQLRTIKPEILRCKRRIDFNKLGLPRPHAAAVARRNERERNRVKQVNLGFAVLREHVPSGRKNRKMSKVDTLKAAVDYIKHLQQVLEEHEAVDAAFSKGVPTVLAPPRGPEPTHSLPSPGGYSSDSSSCSSHEPSSDLPLSPEEEDLLDFASWF